MPWSMVKGPNLWIRIYLLLKATIYSNKIYSAQDSLSIFEFKIDLNNKKRFIINIELKEVQFYV